MWLTLARNLTTNWAYVPDGPKEQWNPYYDVYDDNIRCGPGAATSGRGVETAQVVAGEEIGFVVYSGDYVSHELCIRIRPECI